MSNDVSWTEAGVRVIVRYLEENKGTDSPLLKGQAVALRGLVQDLQECFDANSLVLLAQPNGGYKVRDKFSHIWRTCKKPGRGFIKEFWELGLDGIDLALFIDKFLPANGFFPDDPSRDPPPPFPRSTGGAGGAGGVGGQGPSNATSTQPSGASDGRQAHIKREINKMIKSVQGTDDSPDDPDPRLIQDFDLMAQGLMTSAVEDEKKIKGVDLEDDLEELRQVIEKAIRKLLDGMGFPSHQPFALDLDIFPAPDIAPLLTALMGTVDDWKDTRSLLEKALSSQSTHKMSLWAFLTGLLGAAITRWVFDMEETPELTLEEWLRELEPLFVAHAKKLARLFDHQLGFVLPNRRRPSILVNSTDEYDEEVPRTTAPVVGQQGYFHRDHPLPLDQEPQRPLIERRWHAQWVKDLVFIFGRALHIRGNMAKLGNRLFAFELPAWMDPIGDKDGKVVLIGLLPSVKVLVSKNEPTGEDGEVEVIGEAPESDGVGVTEQNKEGEQPEEPVEEYEWRLLAQGWFHHDKLE